MFQSKSSMKSVTKTCQIERGDACGRPVTVVDTPGLFDTSLSDEEIQQEIMRCIETTCVSAGHRCRSVHTRRERNPSVHQDDLWTESRGLHHGAVHTRRQPHRSKY